MRLVFAVTISASTATSLVYTSPGGTLMKMATSGRTRNARVAARQSAATTPKRCLTSLRLGRDDEAVLAQPGLAVLVQEVLDELARRRPVRGRLDHGDLVGHHRLRVGRDRDRRDEVLGRPDVRLVGDAGVGLVQRD